MMVVHTVMMTVTVMTMMIETIMIIMDYLW